MPLAARHGLRWCGTLSDTGWLGPFLSPCSYETFASTLLLATTLILLLAQGTRLAVTQQLRVQGRLRKGISGLNATYIAAALFLCGTHVLHFAVALTILRRWPFHIVYHACLSVVWGTIASFALYTGRLSVSVDFRVSTIPAAVVYFIRWAGARTIMSEFFPLAASAPSLTALPHFALQHKHEGCKLSHKRVHTQQREDSNPYPPRYQTNI